MLRLIAVTAVICTLLALTGLLELAHSCDGHEGNHNHQPAACVCLCHPGIAVPPEIPVLPAIVPIQRTIPAPDDERVPVGVIPGIDPPPDKHGV